MKKHPLLLSLAVLCALGLAALNVSRAAVEPVPTTFQYATIEWGAAAPRSPQDAAILGEAGVPVTAKLHVVRPDGKVEFFDGRLPVGKVPEGCTQRAYFINLVMNSLAKEGYEFAGMLDDQIVMKRAERR
jgi:hypothetical protein